MLRDLKLSVLPISEKVYINGLEDSVCYENHRADITEEFKRGVVTFCSNIEEFEVNGVKYRTTCERVK